MRPKTRHVCAILGVAIAVGTVVFMQGLVETNDHQATAVAERLLKEVPVATNAAVAQFAIDYRPNGRVMQGPPMMVCVATDSAGRETLDGRLGECVVTKSMFAQRRLPVPPVGTELTLIGRRKTHYLKIAAAVSALTKQFGYPRSGFSQSRIAAIFKECVLCRPMSVSSVPTGGTGSRLCANIALVTTHSPTLFPFSFFLFPS